MSGNQERPRSEALPTAPEELDLPGQRRARALRRIGLGLVAILVGLGASGALGVRTGTVSASVERYTLVVTYARVTRPGLATPWSVEVQRDGGFDGPVVVATTGHYFDLFDENGMDPQPSSGWTAGDLLVWEFDPPRGEVLTVTFDARLEPARQTGARATTSVLVEDRPVVSVTYSTTVMP